MSMDVDGYVSGSIDKCRWVPYDALVAVKELPLLRERGECCELPVVKESWASETSELMKTLADPTRLTMLASLWKAEAPICVCDFTAGLGLTQPTISHHMAKLRAAGLVDRDKRGIWVYYRLHDKLSPSTRRLLGQLIR
jgi:ArsR family transcriptional regulator